ncbi:MAG: roadblock/LC7 domain-containing protein [Actinomycetota bacterium]|nr:roadblock/LC7 domain-containing protein [Actinomycetota bacterium]
MDEYSALAQRISANVRGVLGALILSRDGLVLGAFPIDDESLAKPAWLTFTALGEPDRSFVEFPDQVWAYVRRGPYAAFATAAPGTRPGVLVDQMEQILLVVEELRTRKDAVRVPESTSAPSGKPRTSLHPQVGRPMPSEPVEVMASPPDQGQTAGEGSPDRGGFSRIGPSAGVRDETPPAPAGTRDDAAGDESSEAASPTPEHEAQAPSGQDPESTNDGSEVDPVLLAKEFSGLLQLDSDDDE